ncbi:hypothetical protein I4U23_029782 [Adineta vaga]|nr:hypothetical protein I4U23_029782 [Adineta vaga]
MSNITNLNDILFNLFKNSPIVNEIYFWGYLILFPFGFIGNIASLLTFSRVTLRNISTGCLFIILAISDTIYLLILIIDFVEYGLKIQLYRNVAYDELCRFRSFTSYVTQLNSAWLLVFISIDRWIRTRFPYKSITLCTPKNALYVVCFIFIIDIGLHSHMLTSSYGILIPGLASASCGPNIFTNIGYITWYFSQWTMVQAFIYCIVPVIFMLILLFDTIMNIHSRRQIVFNQTQRINMKTRNLQKQIFILVICRIMIFLATTLPVSLYRIIIPSRITIQSLNLTIIDTVAILNWILSLNYAINFYLNCLTSKLFRDEFMEQFRIIRHRRITPVTNYDTNQPRY